MLSPVIIYTLYEYSTRRNVPVAGVEGRTGGGQLEICPLGRWWAEAVITAEAENGKDDEAEWSIETDREWICTENVSTAASNKSRWVATKLQVGDSLSAVAA